MKNLMPLTQLSIEQLFNADGILQVRYLPGSPRQYRFNASQGVLNLNGLEVLTKPKQAFSFIPVAYRYFEDSLFGKDNKAWVEFFFINETHQMCSVMFHGFSAKEFMKHHADYLFYDHLTPCEVVITATPVEKSNEIMKSKYFIAEFSSVKATPETIEAVRAIVEASQPIYREDTWKEFGRHITNMNYKIPESVTNRAMRLINEEDEQKALEEEFTEIGNSRAKFVKEAA
jgi:hypothetical protein